jgi:hypothetical protein
MALRYPNEAILDSTDYLQIQILKYEKLGTGSILRTKQAYTSGKGEYKNFKDTVFLPIPSNIQDGNSVSYSDDTLDGLTAQVYNTISSKAKAENLGVGEKVAETLKGTVDTLTGADALKIFSTSLATQAANIPFGGNMSVSQVLAREEGQILNPNMELLFNGVNLRSFKFSFKMTPRDDTEAKNIAEIIRRFKSAMAPKLGEKGRSSVYLETPDIFQLTYKKGPDTHPFLNLFKQCFLTDMSVNYTGEGVYATYSDGSPISYTLDLGFKEIEPIYSGDYENKESLVGF